MGDASGSAFVHDEARPTYLNFDLYRSWVKSKLHPDVPDDVRMIWAALGLMEEACGLIRVVRYSEPLDIPRILHISGGIVYHAIGMVDSCSLALPVADVVQFERIAVVDFRNQDVLAATHFGKAVGAVREFVICGSEPNDDVACNVQMGLLAIHRLLITCGYRISAVMLNMIEKLDGIHLTATRSLDGMMEREGSRD